MKVKSMLVIAVTVLMAAMTGCSRQDTRQNVNYEFPVEEIIDETEQDNNSLEVSMKDFDNRDTSISNTDNNNTDSNNADTNNDNGSIPEAATNNNDSIAPEADSNLKDTVTDTNKENNENNENKDNNDNTVSKIQGDSSKEHIGGKVRSIGQESFVISRTLVDAEGYVTMPEAGSPNEQLVTIRCTDSTVFEHWTIQGGGAGITRREASFSEIVEGGGLEAEGDFEGGEFIANKVIIEVYQ